MYAKITKATAKGKTWKAEVFKDGEKIKTIQGGQAGTKLGGARTKAFLARHGNKTVKQHINDLRWKGRAKIGSTIRIPKGKKV